MIRQVISTISMVLVLSVSVSGSAQETGNVTEFPLAWPGQTAGHTGSTHEITYNRKGGKNFWVSGQNYDHIARVSLAGQAEFFPLQFDAATKRKLNIDLGKKSGPHGMAYDDQGELWVSLEFYGFVVRVNDDGKIVEQIDVRIHAEGSKKPINTHPHGLGLDKDGKTIWFTGKKTSTIGKINPDRSVEHFELPTIGAVPIYLAAGKDGNMWCTELVGNKIARITPNGTVTEYDIPTSNSRPIAITSGPDGNMWFSEEAGRSVARIDIRNGSITEFPIPPKLPNEIFAGMVFDGEGNLWTHSYVDAKNPHPAGPDHIIKIDKAIGHAAEFDWIPVTYYEVRSRTTIMHRITQGPDGNIWFTELGIDKLGKLTTGQGKR